MNSFEKVYLVTSLIPRGKVLTYKRVAELAGINNPRVVGFAMHVNKDTGKIPCHRVIGIKGDLVGYARGGIKIKKEILDQEGIEFLEDGRINLDNCLFKPSKKQLLKLESMLNL